MSVTKVSDLHKSATALDMIGDRTKSIQRKKCACCQIAASNGRQNDLQIGNAVGHLLVARKIPNALSELVLTTYYVIIRRRRPISFVSANL